MDATALKELEKQLAELAAKWNAQAADQLQLGDLSSTGPDANDTVAIAFRAMGGTLRACAQQITELLPSPKDAT